MQNKDKFGFYKVGDLKFYSKFDAALVAEKTNQSLTWHFNDEVYSSFDWTKEPILSLPDFYRQRALQLRDDFDYLVLLYSGGADSDNILNTFIQHNIPLDEVAGYINVAATGSTSDYLNGEIFHLTIPKIQQLQQTSQPWLRHTLIDICQLTIDYFSNPENKFDWIHKSNQYVNPNYHARTLMVQTQSHWMHMINAGKRVAFIYGIDKPKIVGVNGRWNLVFRDILDAACVTHNQIDEFPGLYHEMFYWTPDLPQLVIKQAHVLKKFLQKLTADSPFLSKNPHDRNPAVRINSEIYWLNSDGIHTALYPNWKPLPYQFKPYSLIFSPRDNWFFDLPENDVARRTWQTGLEYRWNKTPNFLKNDPNDIRHGFKVSNSRMYDLGP